MLIKLPLFVENCIEILNRAGYEAFCVGGAVRDMLLENPVNDFDIATSCLPQEVERLFPHTVPTGIAHGTVTVVTDGGNIEVTTYRTDGEYFDSRHPNEVKFVGNIKDDLSRRDFTVNAIAYNYSRGIFDPFGGQADAKNKLLKTVGEPSLRFTEDALRIMRLFRFASQLDFNIENGTLAAALALCEKLKDVSAERIREELLKMLCGKAVYRALPFLSSGALSYMGLNPFDCRMLDKLAADADIRLAAAVILSSSDCRAVCDALKLSNKQKKCITALCEFYKNPTPQTKAQIKYMLSLSDAEIFKKYICLLNLKCETDGILKLFNEVISNKEPYLISHLKLDGNGIKNAGVSGRRVGETQKALLAAVIENPALNEPETLKNLITKL